VRLLSRWRVLHGIAEVGLTLAVLALVVLSNVAIAHVAPVIDLTKDKLYTLSPQTEQLLAGLETDIKVLVFIEEGSAFGEDVRSLLAEYQHVTPRVHYEFVVPSLRPAVAREYGVTETATMVVVAGERSRQIPVAVLFAQGDHPDGVKFSGEQSLDQAILELTRGHVEPVLFVTGHGEADPFEKLPELVQDLKRELYRVDSLNLGRGPIPGDAALVILAGPQKDLSRGELEALDGWLRGGGRLMVLLDPAPPGTLPELTGFLARWGVRVDDDIVVDPDRALFTDPTSPVARLDWHPLTEDLVVRGLSVALPGARSMVAENVPAGYEVQQVFGASEAAWGERDLSGSEPKKDPEDVQSPFSMAMAVVVESRDGSPVEPRLLVVGSSGFIHPPMAQFQGNTDFFLNGLDWLVGEEQQMTIRPKQFISQRVFLTPKDARFIFGTTVVVVPLGMFGLGVLAWLRQRSR
jgi:ABC-type uncharacterized transport system involved in gliding motility auxiliary subunit